MAITTNIKNYPATHGKNEGGGGGTTIIMGGGNADIPADLNVTSINAAIGDISSLTGKSLTFNDGQFIYIGANNGTVNKITGDELKYTYGEFAEIQADKIGAKEIETDDLNAVKAWIEALNSKSITTEYLTVTKQAHFFELVIDKIKSVGGQMIMTAANCVVDYAKAVDTNGNYLANLDDASAKAYDIFWLASDASGRAVKNDWQVNDQAICQSFNNVSTGVNYDVSNKYYWRLVTRILTDRYMNLSTGAELPLGQSQQATVNSVTITAPYLADADDTRLDTGWNTQAQQITGVITGATWTETSGGAGEQTIGTMTTTNTVFGIQITPVEGEATGTVNANYFGFACTPARLNVGIYYTDGTSQYFVAPEQSQSSYRYETLTQAPVEAIVITNAEEVEWKLVHGIRLSNTDCDAMLAGYASIPSAGDNVIQLGYRYNQYQETDEEYDIPRSSAIIIAAYHTPDSGLTPPSYAQYTKITDYSLASHRQTYIDANGSRFVGDFYVDANTSIQDLIDEATHTQYYLHIAYANSADGQTDFTKTPLSGISYSYMGYCSNSTASDASLTYADYQWVLVPGGTGANGGHWVYAYKNWTEQPTAPAAGTTIEQLTDGWAATATTPDLENGYATYMSQCFISGVTGQYGTWTTPVRITGENGEAGEPTQIYRLIDNGSRAYVRMSLDSSNNVVEELAISLNYKVAKFVGGTVVFMTYEQLVNFPTEYGLYDGLYAYVKLTIDDTQTTPVWYRLTLNTDGTLTYSYTSTSSRTISNNPAIEVRLIPCNFQSMASAFIGVNYTKDSVFVPITLLPNAAFSIIQGDHASIATLVTGQQGNTQAISTLRQDMNGITTRVTTIEGDYVDESELEQTATNIQLNVYDQLNEKTGIDVSSGTITLNAANTDIVGNLNLRRADNGLTVYDSDGNPKISIHPSSIASKNESATAEMSGHLNECHLYSNPTSFDFTTDTSSPASKLGNYESGTNINITGIYFNAYAAATNSTYEQTWRGTINYEIKIYKDSVSSSNLVKTVTGTTTGSTTTNISNQSYTTATAAYYVTVRFYGSLSNVSSFLCQPTYFMTVDRGLVTEIGTNGLTIKQGTNKFAYFDGNVSELRYDNSGIRLDSTTGSNTIVKQYIGSYTDTSIAEANREIYKSIGLTKKIQTVSSGTWSFMTHPDIDMAICTGAGCTIQLPGYYSYDANYSYNRHIKIPVGTTLYVKGYNNTTVTAPTGSSIVRNESNYDDNQTSVGINSRVHMYICSESTETTAKWIDCLF